MLSDNEKQSYETIIQLLKEISEDLKEFNKRQFKCHLTSFLFKRYKLSSSIKKLIIIDL